MTERPQRTRRKISEVQDLIAAIDWNWARHIARQDNDKWTKRVVLWRPGSGIQSGERLQKRWVRYMKENAVKKWFQAAQDREKWTELEEVYLCMSRSGFRRVAKENVIKMFNFDSL